MLQQELIDFIAKPHVHQQLSKGDCSPSHWLFSPKSFAHVPHTLGEVPTKSYDCWQGKLDLNFKPHTHAISPTLHSMWRP